jgi:hypothetical protein
MGRSIEIVLMLEGQGEVEYMVICGATYLCGK